MKKLKITKLEFANNYKYSQDGAVFVPSLNSRVLSLSLNVRIFGENLKFFGNQLKSPKYTIYPNYRLFGAFFEKKTFLSIDIFSKFHNF